jgi:predicted ribosome quality control (RQC) complex YloA/Tae2 family protein
MPETQADFLDRWRPNRNSTRQAVQSAVPLFGRLLARETIRRADVTTDDPAACSDDEKRRLWQSAEVLRSELSAPEPRIYGNGPFPDAFSLVPLTHRDGEPMETFDSVDDAVSVFVKRKLAEAHFHRLYDPLREKLSEAAASLAHGAERMMEELSSESRAGRYERWGHLLMAQQDEAEAQMEAAVRAAGGEAPDEVEVTLPDLFAEGKPVTIPLDPSRDAVANAEGYYARARRTRRSREEAEARLDRALEEAETAQRLLDEIEAIDTLDAVKRFRKKKEDKLAPFLGQKDETIDRFPFRRFRLGKGFEVWVGRNARQNDELTFHTAQKYDLWMHARGVPGSHVVLHRPNRDAEPTKQQLYTAAGIAAHYSKARGSGLVPVMVAERKYVRSPKGSAPGAVTVEREDVLLVEPGLPQGSADD